MSPFFKANLELFARFAPSLVTDLWDIDTSDFSFCFTQKGELNLKKKKTGAEFFYHDQAGALIEAELLLSLSTYQEGTAVFSYGIGLGYFYDALLPWLTLHPDLSLIFIEDDLSALRMFLESERAEKILLNRQVKFIYVKDTNNLDEILNAFFQVAWVFRAVSLFSKYCLVSLHLYGVENRSSLALLHTGLLMTIAFTQYSIWDISTTVNVDNFYRLIIKIPDLYSSAGLQNCLSEQPMLLCGAGPSVKKESHIVSEIADNLFLLASGTGVNVLNQLGINPHLGGCVDPSPAEADRIKTNSSFELPFFITPNLHFDALNHIHGPLILTRESIKEKWKEHFFVEFGVESQWDINAFYSTSNYCTQVAIRLGVSPLIFIGVDMAYERKERYAENVSSHGGSALQIHQSTAGHDLPIVKLKAQGEILDSSLQFSLEQLKMHEALMNCTSQEFLNASKIGLEVPHARRIDLKTWWDTSAVKQCDTINEIHAMIILQPKFDVSYSQIIKSLRSWKKELQEAQAFGDEILRQFQTLRSKSDKELSELLSCYTTKAIILETSLEESAVYRDLLNDKIQTIDMYQENDKRFVSAIAHRLPVGEYKRKLLALLIEKYRLILKVLTDHLDTINQAIIAAIEVDEGLKKLIPTAIPKSLPEIHRPPDMNFAKETLQYYKPGGSLKKRQYYKGDKLHGPSQFFSPQGTLLAEGVFVEGKRSGPLLQYYPSGKLYSLQHWDNGQRVGIHSYYYENGCLKTELSYENGCLQGTVKLFYPNGSIKKEIEFRNNGRDGRERYYRINGELEEESHFRAGKPVGIYQRWHRNGMLACKHVYHEGNGVFDVFEWNEKGELIKEVKSEGAHPKQTTSEKLKSIKNTLMELYGSGSD